MESAKKRLLSRKRKKLKIRKKISGTGDNLRVTVFRSAKHLYLQAIDDEKGSTLLSLSTLSKEIKEKNDSYPGNKISAQLTGKIFGEKLLEIGCKTIKFDRNGFLFHGRVKSAADGIREAGINF